MNLFVYGTRVNDGQPAVVLVDCDLQPDPQRPVLFVVRVPLAEPRADGTAGPDEIEALWDISAALAEAGGDAATAAGTIVSDGRALVCFYVAADADLAAYEAGWVSNAMAAHGNREWSCESQPDPDWDVFTGVLLPAGSDRGGNPS